MLSLLHQVLLAVTLGLCVFVLVPRMFGGAGGRSERGGPDPGRLSAHQQGKVNFGSGRQHLVHREGKTYENIQQMRNAVEQNIKERSKGHGKGLTFTLMPLYAIGVGVFAAYKFLKIKSKEESSSRMEKNEEDKKAKETENQLLELEQRLAQTETMLNSLLSQLDPLSNCVTVLANNHKDEIMTQLQSIRQLMKESEINKLEQNLEGENGICKEKLEDLIQSLGKHCQVEEVDDNREAVLPETDNEEYCRTADNEHNEHGLHFSHMTDSKYTEIRDRDVQEDASQDVKHSRLRRRNRKD